LSRDWWMENCQGWQEGLVYLGGFRCDKGWQLQRVRWSF
jgi:hypothetical protein